MLVPWFVATLICASILLVAGQLPHAKPWTDPLTGITFHRHNDPEVDISWGYVFPPPGKDEFIGFFTGPGNLGWVGNSLGGQMRNNTLIVGWVYQNKALVSARWATGFSPPQPLTSGPKLTVLGTSGDNGTHTRIFYRCENCSKWTGGSGGINLNGTQAFGSASHAAIKPLEPENPNSTLYQHTLAYEHELDTVEARSETYNADLQKLLDAPALPPGTPSTTTTSGPAPTNIISCPGAPAPIYPLNVAGGWKVGPLLGRLSAPRSLQVDSRGNLIILERDIGITGHTVDAVGCVTSSKVIVRDPEFNHGLDVVGNKLFASSSDLAWVWDYDPTTMTATNKRVLVKDMHNPWHLTRSILVSRKFPDYISLTVGSDGNLDLPSIDPALGRAQVRVFDMRNLPQGGASYNGSSGKVFGYGQRNNVGITEDRNGNVFVIENSLDDAHRVVDGVKRDIHDDNPAEKITMLGNPTNPNETMWAGYPECYSVWEPRDITDNPNLRPGDWFVQDPTGEWTDARCEAEAAKPLAILPPHAAPLDIKFGVRPGDDNLYVALHGSSARTTTLGYKVLAIPGHYNADGEWRPNADLVGTKTSTVDILFNNDESRCRAGCFRPCAMAFAADGKTLYVSSDSSGEVFILKLPDSVPEVPTTSITTGPGPTPTTTPTQTQPTSTTPSPVITAPPTIQTMFGQCGGMGWLGPTRCVDGARCVVFNIAFSQCIPA